MSQVKLAYDDYYTRDFGSFQYPLFITKKSSFLFCFIVRDSLLTVSQSITFVNSAFICKEFGFVINFDCH